jgi:hypothetical protein
MLSVIEDVPIDNEASVVTSSISRFVSLTQFFGGAHKGRVCVRACVQRSECVLMYVSIYICN